MIRPAADDEANHQFCDFLRNASEFELLPERRHCLRNATGFQFDRRIRGIDKGSIARKKYAACLVVIVGDERRLDWVLLAAGRAHYGSPDVADVVGRFCASPSEVLQRGGDRRPSAQARASPQV